MMNKGAIFSPDRKYRYSLWRFWDERLPIVLFVGLNPSTADETEDDPTIRRCVNFAKEWGYGRLYMGNLFAYRATQPSEMKIANDPVGPENNNTLLSLHHLSDLTVAAWSNDGKFKKRDQEVKLLIPDLHILKLNNDGSPSHPLYLKKSLTPEPWNFNA